MNDLLNVVRFDALALIAFVATCRTSSAIRKAHAHDRSAEATHTTSSPPVVRRRPADVATPRQPASAGLHWGRR